MRHTKPINPTVITAYRIIRGLIWIGLFYLTLTAMETGWLTETEIRLIALVALAIFGWYILIILPEK